MKQLIIMFLSFGYCYAMDIPKFTMPGLDQHPYWQDEEYQHAAQDCFSHLNDLLVKKAVKEFCTKKQITWQELLNPDIHYHIHEDTESAKLLPKEEKLIEESKFFFTKWDNTIQFIPPHPLTKRGHNNTALLRIFFKDFTFQVFDLYLKARNQIIQKIDPNYRYKDEDDFLVQQFYPTKSDRIKALLKEAIKVNDALLKCFDSE